jgi:hypothetical protein
MVPQMTPTEVEVAVRTVACDLVRLQRASGTSFVNLPLLYPDGSAVTVKIDSVAGGMRVSDAGFAYREAEDSGIDRRSFVRTAKRIAEEFAVDLNQTIIYVDTPTDALYGAICDVAAASWQTASRIDSRLPQEDDIGLETELIERLKIVFGEPRVEEGVHLKGISSSDWPVSAVVSLQDHQTVFQAVGDHPNSIYRTATAFHDLSELRRPPRLVAVVNDQLALGPRLTLLTQAHGYVIEKGSADDAWLRVAA